MISLSLSPPPPTTIYMLVRGNISSSTRTGIRHDHSFHLLYAVHVRGKTNCVELWYPSMLLGNLLSSMRESPITEVVAPIDSSSPNWCFTPSRVKHLTNTYYIYY